jgi:hypothetical protein
MYNLAATISGVSFIQCQLNVLYDIFIQKSSLNLLYHINISSHCLQNQVPHFEMAPKSANNARLRRSAKTRYPAHSSLCTDIYTQTKQQSTSQKI